MQNKLARKHPGVERFLWWIDWTKTMAFFRRPPCYCFWWEKSLRSRLKKRILHFVFCRRLPWRLLPHKPGRIVEDYSVLKEEMARDYREQFGEPILFSQ